MMSVFFFFSSRRRHTRFDCDWSSDVCSSDLDRSAGDHGMSFDLQLGGLRVVVTGGTLGVGAAVVRTLAEAGDRKSTRLNSSHSQISYAVFCLKKKKKQSQWTEGRDIGLAVKEDGILRGCVPTIIR